MLIKNLKNNCLVKTNFEGHWLVEKTNDENYKHALKNQNKFKMKIIKNYQDFHWRFKILLVTDKF